MSEGLRSDPLLSGIPEVDGYKVLDPAVLYAKVGEGGMGSVYRGRHLNLDIDVAVKVLDPDLARKDNEFVARFRREANLAAKINHSNLVRVFDVKSGSGLHYLVMEYVEGETALERVARKGKLGAVEALDITLEAAKGLGAAHARGVVHRDVKPENLLIDREGNVKVADLGLAHAAGGGGLTQTKVRMGTPRYMPPEQWEDARTVGPAGDVWALGATAYFLLAGDHAIRDGSLPEILKRVCLEPFPDIRKRRPEVPPDLVSILEKCTSKRPGDRYANASELAEAFHAFRRRLETPPLLPDERAGAGTTRLAAVSPPPTRTIARIKEGASPGTPSAPAPTGLPTPPRARKRSLVPLLVAVALLVAAGVAYLLFKGKEGVPGAKESSQPAAEDYDLQAEVHTLRERLGAMPREIEERAARAGNDGERAILRALEVFVRQALNGPAVVRIDTAIRSGDSMLQGRGYAKARERFEGARRDLDSLFREIERKEQQLHVAAELSAASKLRSEVAGWYGTNGLKETETIARGTKALRTAEEDLAKGEFAKARAGLQDAVRDLEAARAAGPGLVADLAAAREVETAARLAEAKWARERPQGAPATVGKEALDDAAVAMEEQRFASAREGYEVARDALAAMLRAASAWKEAAASQSRWETLKEAGAPEEAPEARTAAEKMRDGEGALAAGDASTAEAAFVEAKRLYLDANRNAEALAAALASVAGPQKAAGEALVAWNVVKAAAKLDGVVLSEEDGKEGAAKLDEAEEALSRRDFPAAVARFAEAKRLLGAAAAKGNTLLAARRTAISAREGATKARAAWETLATDRKLVPPKEVAAAAATMAKAEAEFGKQAFEAAAKAFVEAEKGFRTTIYQVSVKVPAGWNAVGEALGIGSFARRAEDPRTGIVFILVEPGTFAMGSPEGEGRDDERPRHEVRITKPFYLAETETTVGQWRKFAKVAKYKTEAEQGDGGWTFTGRDWWDDPRATWKEPLPWHTLDLDDRHPVTQVTWDDAKAFCDHWSYRLPTEAEWEYACRAGTKEKYWWGDGEADGKGKLNLYDASATRALRPHFGVKWDDGQVFMAPVGSFEANPWGFRDILGNVSEWCADGYDEKSYQRKGRDDPLQPEGENRVVRGGSWDDSALFCRVGARRSQNQSSFGDARIGFRVARTP